MGRYPNARAYFLEGFPREARQVEDFEQNVCLIPNKYLICLGSNCKYGDDSRLR
jgi:hypothetical protein